MFILRCTRKLLAKLRVRPEAVDSVRSTTRLGDWYADFLDNGRERVVLCVSEHARVPVVLSADDLKTFPSRFPGALGLVLNALSIPPSAVARELGEMQVVHFAKTASRSVLGTINDFAIPVTWAQVDDPGISLHRLSVRLTDTPVGPLKHECPADVVRRLLT